MIYSSILDFNISNIGRSTYFSQENDCRIQIGVTPDFANPSLSGTAFSTI
jgi:hypothetical protein